MLMIKAVVVNVCLLVAHSIYQSILKALPRFNNMGEGECLMLYRVVKNDCVNSKGFPSA